MSLLKEKYISNRHDYLLSARGEEKADQRSVVGMSQNANAFTLTPLAEFTHPIYASLGLPLFYKQKGGYGGILFLK
jgi:hypothetical protein